MAEIAAKFDKKISVLLELVSCIVWTYFAVQNYYCDVTT